MMLALAMLPHTAFTAAEFKQSRRGEQVGQFLFAASGALEGPVSLQHKPRL